MDKSLEKRSTSSRIADVTITSLSYHGNIEESTVHIHKIAELHSGQWTCAIGQLQQKSVNIFVITPNTKVTNFEITKISTAIKIAMNEF